MQAGKAIGYVSSGGYAHHIKKSVAMGYIPSKLVAEDSMFEIEILGNLYPAYITSLPLYDPNGDKMRQA